MQLIQVKHSRTDKKTSYMDHYPYLKKYVKNSFLEFNHWCPKVFKPHLNSATPEKLHSFQDTVYENPHVVDKIPTRNDIKEDRRY